MLAVCHFMGTLGARMSGLAPPSQSRRILCTSRICADSQSATRQLAPSSVSISRLRVTYLKSSLCGVRLLRLSSRVTTSLTAGLSASLSCR